MITTLYVIGCALAILYEIRTGTLRRVGGRSLGTLHKAPEFRGRRRAMWMIYVAFAVFLTADAMLIERWLA